MNDQPAERCQCEEALDKLEEYLDSEIGELDGNRLREHLAECSSCFGEAELEQRLRAVLRRSCHETAPETLRVRVRTEITVIRSRTSGAG
jgi:anti-sigma factor (TIGR02949 family)